jgi:maleylacetate reductase
MSIPAMERIVFGTAFIDAVAEEVERIDARRVFLVVSGSLNRRSDEIGKLRTRLGGRYAGLFDAIPQHVQRDAVLLAAEVARDAGADLLVSVGGGSVTDATKTVRLCLEHNLQDLDAFEPFLLRSNPETGALTAPDFRGPTIRHIAVPTTLSGGEFSPTAGSTDPVRKLKQGIRHPGLIPYCVVLDPHLALHTPMETWLSTGIRCVDHAVEGYCSLQGNAMADACSLLALPMLARGLRASNAAPDSADARAMCQNGMWLAQIPMWSGVPMGASHGIGHVLGGSMGVPHGYCSCVTLPSVLRYNAAAGAGRQAELSEALGQPGVAAGDAIAALIDELGLPRRLRDVGLMQDRFDEIASKSMLDRWVHTNPVPIRTPDDVRKILSMAA